MQEARAEQQRCAERERLRKLQQEQQKQYINEYRAIKRRTDLLLDGETQEFQQLHPGGQAMFYERQQNFGGGFPITTITTNGKVITTHTKPMHGITSKRLPSLNSDIIKGGQAQLDSSSVNTGEFRQLQHVENTDEEYSEDQKTQL
jgi:hypothetical protein